MKRPTKRRVVIACLAATLTAAPVLVAAGQAVGPVLTFSLAGTANVTVEQAVRVAGAPAASGADDALGAVDDEGTTFTVAIETQAGQTSDISIPLDTTAGSLNAVLELNVPPGVDAGVSSGGRMKAAQLAPSRWLVATGCAASGGAGPASLRFDTHTVHSSLGALDLESRVDIAAADRCALFVAYADVNAGTVEVRKSADGGATWGAALVLASGLPAGHASSVAIAAPAPDTAFVAYVANTTASTGNPSDALVLHKIAASGTALASAASVTVDPGTGSRTTAENRTSVALAAPTSSNAFVIWLDADNNDNGTSTDERVKVIAAVESGGSISLGSPITLDASASLTNNASTAIAAPDASTVFVAWSDGAGSIKADALSASGTVLSGGGVNVAILDGSADTSAMTAIAAPAADRVIVAWHNDAEEAVKARAATVSGDVLTFGGVLTVGSSAGAKSDVGLVAPTPTDAFVAWFSAGSNEVLIGRLTVSGTSLSLGTQATIDDDAGPEGNVAIAAPDAATLFVAYFDDADNDALKVAASAGGLSLTIEPKDDVQPGFFTIRAKLTQIGG